MSFKQISGETDFYTKQAKKVFKFGLTTVYNNYLSAEFFLLYCENFRPDSLADFYRFIVHLETDNFKDREARPFIKRSTFRDRLIKCSRLLASSLDQYNINYPEELKNDIKIFEARCSLVDIFALQKRKQLEDFLLYLDLIKSDLVKKDDLPYVHSKLDS
jgi:hypothetical protein